MATTGAVMLFKTNWAASTVSMRSTGASMVLPFRIVSGQFSTSLTTSANKKNWKPHALVPFVDAKTGLIAPEWNRFLGDLSNRKLGGPSYPTLPDLTNYITKAQLDSVVSSAIQSALEQQVVANAQALQTVVQTVQSAALPGAAQIPPVVLVKQDTSQPIYIPPEDSKGGD